MTQLLTLDATGRELVRTELAPGESTLRLRCLPGATAIQVAWVDGETTSTRVEVPAEGGEEVALRVQLSEAGGVTFLSSGRPVLTLAPDARYRPAPPLLAPEREAPLDLALVIDGTMLAASGDGPLLADKAAWAEQVERLIAFGEALAASADDLRACVVAFADEAPPQVRAADLKPEYRLRPEPSHRRLRASSPAALRKALLAVEPSSGGDFVDALADALVACAELHWRAEARKVLVVVGDSPGHSLLEPAPAGADACVREQDVDDAALVLHERGVLIATVYQVPESKVIEADLEAGRELLRYAAGQYQRLASRPELAFELATLDPAAVAERLVAERGPLGRHASWGALVEVG